MSGSTPPPAGSRGLRPGHDHRLPGAPAAQRRGRAYSCLSHYDRPAPGVDRYVDEWITAVEDITERTQRIGALVAARELDQARARLPPESPYPLPPEIAEHVQAD